MGLFGRRKHKTDPYAESLARSVSASATVVSAQRSSSSPTDVNSSSETYVVELDVQQSDGDAVRRRVQWTVFDVAVPDVQPGVTLSVSVDPERPGIVYPPGYPPPNARPGVISLADARILPTSKWLDEQLN
jgi:predicted RNA-binding protein with TRAM domain